MSRWARVPTCPEWPPNRQGRPLGRARRERRGTAINQRGEIIIAVACIIGGAILLSSLIVAYKPRIMITVKKDKPANVESVLVKK